ncbi:type II toxin-antitoxin system RelE/ParE family toxin [Larkinella bovis]|uniref:Type II toxin-antitoxin system RelE/ParE family toxin n=1 Tax=Larkinella bovis TaxID=683041 RepID=A0ABW0IE50_9BACT
MISSFKHKGLKQLFEEGIESGLPAKQIPRIKNILSLLNVARDPRGMNFPGSNFHPLKGDRKGEYAVSVTGNYRITFRFDKKKLEAYDVNYEDYH